MNCPLKITKFTPTSGTSDRFSLALEGHVDEELTGEAIATRLYEGHYLIAVPPGARLKVDLHAIRD